MIRIPLLLLQLLVGWASRRWTQKSTIAYGPDKTPSNTYLKSTYTMKQDSCLRA
jgi:hypothetical protein